MSRLGDAGDPRPQQKAEAVSGGDVVGANSPENVGMKTASEIAWDSATEGPDAMSNVKTPRLNQK